MTAAHTATRIDVRALETRERHPTIFKAFESLAPREAMELVNDHDPWPLFLHFQAQFPRRFQWEDLERGPQTWRVRITSLPSTAGEAGTCCGGGCGGGA